ncbi:hypothetical protein FA13DRAFT_446071 [Coprinellus micaceus]|uniref:Uncharacterized protein n=1 Tax=Coprinellus micaceus TaxID=71717 RepID=A0A4Y7TZ93_COPMI|nr:hypothetical protein FA13DRAFT_446071 [Coprinellus micaceus]
MKTPAVVNPLFSAPAGCASKRSLDIGCPVTRGVDGLSQPISFGHRSRRAESMKVTIRYPSPPGIHITATQPIGSFGSNARHDLLCPPWWYPPSKFVPSDTLVYLWPLCIALAGLLLMAFISRPPLVLDPVCLTAATCQGTFDVEDGGLVGFDSDEGGWHHAAHLVCEPIDAYGDQPTTRCCRATLLLGKEGFHWLVLTNIPTLIQNVIGRFPWETDMMLRCPYKYHLPS